MLEATLRLQFLYYTLYNDNRNALFTVRNNPPTELTNIQINV